ncbi:XCL1 protein, partial [Calyptomena viridis]|nr:XCL1 protein [Calyptomena viridis]
LTIFPVLGSAGSQAMRKFRCVNLHTRQLNIRNLVGYEKQTQANAVMFITKKGIRICVSPDQEWVQSVIKKINQRSALSRN